MTRKQKKLRTGKLYADEQISVYRSTSGSIHQYFDGKWPVTVAPALVKAPWNQPGTGTCVWIEFSVPRERLSGLPSLNKRARK
jgi:hypothetical protein